MSDRWVSWAWWRNIPTLGEKVILVCLGDLADDSGRLVVTSKELGRRTDFPVWRVDAALTQLARLGFISARPWDESGAWSVALLEKRSGHE